jgi:hypothetical protein
MEAGAKPFKAKFTQHAEALERLEKSFGKDWKKTKETADKLLNSVEATERERLYGLYTQIDIKEIKSESKEFLIAALYTLSSKSSNEFQQSYIRSVQKYLDIKNPQTNIKFEGVENIDSQNAQKAIFQSCVEYLLLENDDSSFFEEYEEQLFSHFVIKEKDKVEIWESVLQIFLATGPMGLAEKYGFVPVFKDKEKVLSDEENLLEKYFIDELWTIPYGQEAVIENKQIVFK